MIRNTLPILCLVSLPAAALSAAEPGWRPLFNGRNLDGWTVTLDGRKAGEDPDKLVQVRDGAVHMYPDVAEGAKVPFGVITHEGEFSRYQFRFEYRWVGKRFEPRAKELRDAGLIYHVKDASKIWPAGVECQVQEGDTGDLVFLETGGTAWMRPAGSRAPDGQGDPGMLPEHGGFQAFRQPPFAYIGRFEEADSPSGWNRVVVTVHGAEHAEHVVNDRVIVRTGDFIDKKGAALSSGKLCLQLEGAEITYRNIEIRELDEPARPDHRVLALSAVKGKPAREAKLRIHNPGTAALPAPRVTGADAAAFAITSGPDSLAAGDTGEWGIAFRPQRGAGRYSAGFQLGDAAEGTFVVLQGVALDAFEGENEPPLQRIVHALGIPLDVGGEKLELDKDKPSIGAGVAASYFTAAGDGKPRITPLARFSPPGETPVGIFTRGSEELHDLGSLASSKARPDSHQCLHPTWADGSATLEIDPPAEPFGFFMKGHHYISFTDPERPSKAKIRHKARVYPARSIQGNRLENAWIIGFEEASNGDYQDAVLLVEGVKPVIE